ncbi:TetR/AcrR family transcriptional regulator [Alteromonas pelagimontana]|uniref:TetR/AcrR family transcriptional regulator n=1 Tax=Alteromonas pelagimontana TaxID=1858656 RepID=A0A6M4MFC6_9ALTE|nr:TetR/AcrR family transcriptional regulator [Alteromonas pelagimontana]QJR81687.1 TetR/AcrR family transcriptional regulator [Alteromonas pelagimontana]
MITPKSHPQESVRKSERQGSRRIFDKEKGTLIAKDLFHQRGFDAVGIAELTRTLGINPPSLYAAYGSKVNLFEMCLEAYIAEGNLPADEILSDGRDTVEALSELIQRAAELYTQSDLKKGCMVAEGLRADDNKARAVSNKYLELSRIYIKDFVLQQYPDKADFLADYIVVTLQGLSAAAFSGLPKARALAVASATGKSVSYLLS